MLPGVSIGFTEEYWFSVFFFFLSPIEDSKFMFTNSYSLVYIYVELKQEEKSLAMFGLILLLMHV